MHFYVTVQILIMMLWHNSLNVISHQEHNGGSCFNVHKSSKNLFSFVITVNVLVSSVWRIKRLQLHTLTIDLCCLLATMHSRQPTVHLSQTSPAFNSKRSILVCNTITMFFTKLQKVLLTSQKLQLLLQWIILCNSKILATKNMAVGPITLYY